MTTPRRLTKDDLWTFKDVGPIALSPDGRFIAYVVHSLDKTKNVPQSAIWLLQLDEHGRAVGAARRITSGAKNDTDPVWSPDSRRLLFLSDREDEKNQLWLINIDGGEASRVTNMLYGVSAAAWSPDGLWVAFTSMAATTDDDDLLVGRKTLNANEKKKREEEERIRFRTITRIFYRLDGRGVFDKFTHLFVMPAPSTDNSQIDPAAIRRLTSGDFDHSRPSWTPDSKEIGVLCNRADDRDRSFINDLWAISRETGKARCLSDGTLEIESYSWSPDGSQAILVAAKDRRVKGGCNAHLYLVSREGDSIQDVTAAIDNHTTPAAFNGYYPSAPYIPHWSSDGKRLYFLVTERACINIYRLDIAQKAVTALTAGEQVIYYMSLLPDERGLVVAQGLPSHLLELYLLPLPATGVGATVQFTHLHDQQMGEFVWSEAERIHYRGANNDEIEGWIMRPAGAKEGVRYPLVVSIHGGPQSAFGVSLDPVHEYLAAQGFAVFYCNPHGSTGHGQDFMREIEGDWGGWDYEDIMRGVDECIARGIADPERLMVTGYSYGGYMSMFIIGHTDRFKAAVPMAGVSNLSSFVGTSDIGFWQVLQSKGYPWEPEREAYYKERSPLSHAKRVTTPTLFVHPENDLRCPIEQSEQFYMALKMMGSVPVEFVRVPGSWHVGTAKPSQYIQYWELMVEWFRKYVQMHPEEYE